MTGHELQELLDSINTDDPSNLGAIFRVLMFKAKPALDRGDLDTARTAMESAAIVALGLRPRPQHPGPGHGRGRRHLPVQPDPDTAQPARAGH